MKLSPRIPRTVPQKAKQPDPKRNAAHLTFIRSLPCLGCGSSNRSQAHHLLGLDLGKGMGLRVADRFTVPLCNACHSTLHDLNHALLADIGIDERAVANSLWKITGDFEAGQSVIWKAQNRGGQIAEVRG